MGILKSVAYFFRKVANFLWDQALRLFEFLTKGSDMPLALSFLWKGMLGVFAFMFLFYGIITGLDRIFVKNKKEN